MFRVEWLQPVLDHMTEVWIENDSSMRGAMTAATAEIDRRLKADPHSVGESRSLNVRVDFVYPLFYTFHVSAESNTVTVVHVRLYRRRIR